MIGVICPYCDKFLDNYVVKNEFGFEEEWEQKLIPTKLSPWVRKQND